MSNSKNIFKSKKGGISVRLVVKIAITLAAGAVFIGGVVLMIKKIF